MWFFSGNQSELRKECVNNSYDNKKHESLQLLKGIKSTMLF